MLLGLVSSSLSYTQESTKLKLEHTIKGNITPKSIIHNGHGLFFAQNMMYKHKITVYDRNFDLLKTISDKVKLGDFNIKDKSGEYQGSPVEATATKDGKYVWVSNYQMYGKGYSNPGKDACKTSSEYDKSYLYKINVNEFDIDDVVEVGCVPKYLDITKDEKYVLVSNWCSGDVSIIDVEKGFEIKKVKVGSYPRGVVIDNQNNFAYVAIMGSTKIAKIDLKSIDFDVLYIENVGKKPRHLCISPNDKFIYASLNSENKIAKIDLKSQKVIKKVYTGSTPRSMVLQKNGMYLYVVNYNSNTMSRIRTADMKVVQRISTGRHPIGITYDDSTQKVWVACYSGSIKIYKTIPNIVNEPTLVSNKKQGTNLSSKIEISKNRFGNFHVIVGVFKNRKNSQKIIEYCNKKGYNAYIAIKSKTLEKVSCANFLTRKEAEKALIKIKSDINKLAWILEE